MSDIREAFQKAAKQNPDSKVAGIFRKVEHSQYIEQERQANRHTVELGKTRGRFVFVGLSWFRLNVDHSHMRPQELSSIEKIREEWQRLQPLLVNMHESERPRMIGKLADGLKLSEEGLKDYYTQIVVSRMLENPLEAALELFNKTRFSPASKVFFEVLSDISGYSEEQKTSFNEFMNAREDLRGSVTLPQTFPAVAQWLVQQSNTAKKT